MEPVCLKSDGIDAGRALDAEGFFATDTTIIDEAALRQFVLSEACKIGDILPGRFGQSIEKVVPQSRDTAYDGSLSAHYGTEALPFHMDSAHRLIPARTLIVACLNPGEHPVATHLIDTKELHFSSEDIRLLRSAVFLVQTGRRSFYSSILSAERSFMRFDSGCLKPIDERSEQALHIFEHAVKKARVIDITWQAGRVLRIDNWRMLHGRAQAQRSLARVLLRSCIK